MSSRDHFMEGTAGQASARELAINLRQAEWQMRRRRSGERALQSRDGLSKSGDAVTMVDAQDWLHESKLEWR